MNVFIIIGALIQLEMSLNLFNSFSKQAKDDDYLERDNVDYADEDLVMQIAGNWSINPIKLSERTDIEDNLGFVAYYLHIQILCLLSSTT